MRTLIGCERAAVVLLTILTAAVVDVSFGVRPIAPEREEIADDAVATLVETGTIELVESVPIETALDLPELRNTPEVWTEMIQGAQHTIDIETFYFSADPVQADWLHSILVELARASQRGVRVRALSDASFAETYPEIIARLSAQQGTETRTLDARAEWGGVIHAKYFIVDDHEVFVGSQNWDWRALEHIHELGVRIRHKDIVTTLRSVFEMDWALAGSELTAATEDLDSGRDAPDDLIEGPFYAVTPNGDEVSITIAASPEGALPVGIQWDEPLLVQFIDGAQTRLRLHLLTFNPVERHGTYHEALESALRRAAARGVDVRVILSNWSKRDYMLPYVTSLGLIPGISIRFTNIPEWSGGFIPYARVEHPKYLVADDSACWIGTSNWTRGGFHESRNISVFVEGEAFAEHVAKYFENSWNSEYAEDVDACQEYEPPRISGQ